MLSVYKARSPELGKQIKNPSSKICLTCLRPLNWLVPRKRMGFYDSSQSSNSFVDRFIEEALALSPEELDKKTNHDEGYTFLHAIAGYTRDRQMLRDQLVSVLLAGRVTTACSFVRDTRLCLHLD